MSRFENVAWVACFALLVAGCSSGGSSGGGAPVPAPSVSPNPSPSPTVALTVSPQQVDFNAVQGQNPAPRTITITTPVGWAANSSVSWLTVGTPTSGAGNGSTTLWVDASGLQPGFHQGTVTVFSSQEGLTRTVPVTLMLSAGMPSGTMPSGFTQEIRPLLGTSVEPVSLQDNMMHVYHVPGVAGIEYGLTIDTTPSGQPVTVEVAELRIGGQMSTMIVNTPYTATVTSGGDSRLRISVFDHAQAGLTLSTLTVTRNTAAFPGATFGAVVHVCGDLPIANAPHNGLATAQDRADFVNELAQRTNSVLPSPVQIGGALGVSAVSNAQVTSVDPALVDGGLVRYPSGSQQRALAAAFGAPASDPTFGRAVDIFVVHSPRAGESSALGTCSCVLGFDGSFESLGLGGTFEGNGPESSIVIRLFDDAGNPFTMQELADTLAHELGHFLSLYHTTETDYRRVDDLPDTPFSVDTNGDDVLNDNGPDRTNVMHGFALGGVIQRDWTPGQIQAMQDYLSLRAH